MGSNDGTLLKIFKSLGTKILGVDPAQNLAAVANKNGIETWDTFFNKQIAEKVAKEKQQASVVIGTNVFAHINNLDDVLEGLNLILTKDGVFVAEFPYLVDLISKTQFDTIYHEHLSYWAIRPLITLFKRFDMSIFDVQKVSSHGGSIRIFVKRTKESHKINKRV